MATALDFSGWEPSQKTGSGGFSGEKVKVEGREDTREMEGEMQMEVHLRGTDPQGISEQQSMQGVSHTVHL